MVGGLPWQIGDRSGWVPPGSRFVMANISAAEASEDAFYSIVDNLPLDQFRYGNLELGDCAYYPDNIRLMSFEEMRDNNGRENVRAMQTLEEFYAWLDRDAEVPVIRPTVPVWVEF